MKAKPLRFIAGGMDERRPAEPGNADFIQNFTVDRRTKGWSNKLGWEKLFTSEAAWAPFTNDSPVDSCYVWTTNGGALEYWLYEEDGSIYLLDWNPTTNSPRKVELDIETNDFTLTDPRTFYNPIGEVLIITNGTTPHKFRGRPWDVPATAYTGPQPVETLGWYQVPPQPRGWEQETDFTTDPSGGESSAVWATRGSQIETGVGSATNAETNLVRWRYTCVNRDGSESPMSEASNYVSWTTPVEGRRQVPLVEIPRGPTGTIARNVYRTRNIETDGEERYYYVDTIWNNIEEFYYDHRGDDSLVVESPSDGDSIVMPAPRCNYSATFNGCLFVDGGVDNPTTLYWSNPGFHDTYSGLDNKKFGGNGGAITGVHAWYNVLLVFREKSIEVVQGDYANGFQFTTLSNSIGSRSPHSVQTVPGIGVFFLGNDGMYTITGGLTGGAQMQVVFSGETIIKTTNRLTKELAVRAVSCYSDKWKEYQCFFPADGESVPTLGVVFHPEKNAWSTRDSSWPVGCMTTTAEGEIIFGHNTGGSGKIAGLFVQSRKRTAGQNDAGTDQDPPTSIWRSTWHDVQDPTLEKYVKYIYLHVLTQGDNGITLTYKKDYSYSGDDTREQTLQRAKYADQNVYDTAVYGTGTWEEGFLTEIRYDVSSRSANWFQWEFSTTNDILLTGYTFELNADGTKTYRGKNA